MQDREPLLAVRIEKMVHAVLFTDDEKQGEVALAEAKAIFTKRELPTIAAVGDEAS